ncbi:hypothetical protein Y1Q_0023229 [Alligator mississippiensis]|uniref:Uncharacterized protein n=1 Tax=Alligator mississippiensis TaxID=8496 RepID=A0A151MJ29_ALLMI|nr:hypothetical protein Y1Q_0023229 [Alligator mississippiensis]
MQLYWRRDAGPDEGQESRGACVLEERLAHAWWGLANSSTVAELHEGAQKGGGQGSYVGSSLLQGEVC